MRSVESSGVGSGRDSEREGESQLIEAWSEGKLKREDMTETKKRRGKKERNGRKEGDGKERKRRRRKPTNKDVECRKTEMGRQDGDGKKRKVKRKEKESGRIQAGRRKRKVREREERDSGKLGENCKSGCYVTVSEYFLADGVPSVSL
ncbi:hypothetical protein E2C01_062692 [Portunus trituberculatus]|uniref:Uncharacterized protein n=1 Tax=Portunus trituberculatus TaxID=210409 RepID=A0A5B7H8K6_PORTR|nr:hypothetical protein [Portunus trituberculatus]